MEDALTTLYRQLPSVNDVLERPEVVRLLAANSREGVTEAARGVIAELRERVRLGMADQVDVETAVEEIGDALRRQLAASQQPRLRRVINATGVILQTNLGRAPLSEAAIERIAEVARGYCNLEFDLEGGERSRRDILVEALILRVLGLGGTEDPSPRSGGPWAAAVVNNCAAATFLTLNTLAAGGEVIVSRGELVEIGGGFRIPDMLAKSGAVLREVGTTNKTRIGDYEAALRPETRLILRVHRSNFEIRGFTEQPSVEDLLALGRRAGVPVFDDQGTGCLVDLTEFGFLGEGSLRESVRRGVDVVAASGDKLLGGPQCGLLVGSDAVVERIRANPLFRALRVDKLTYAALEATLHAYLAGREDEVPVLRMMRLPPEAVRVRCDAWVEALGSEKVGAEVIPAQTAVGGGTTPGATLASFAVRLQVDGMSEAALARHLRGLEPPVVGRVSGGFVLLDLRTVPAEDDSELIAMLQTALGRDAA